MQTIRTPEKRAEFLSALAELGNVKEACVKAGIARNSAYLWRSSDVEFGADWDKHLAVGAETLEDEAIRRARDGWDEPVWHQGSMCGTVRKYSDTLLIFLLKGAKPDKYRERMEHTGKDGGSMQFTVTRAGKQA